MFKGHQEVFIIQQHRTWAGSQYERFIYNKIKSRLLEDAKVVSVKPPRGLVSVNVKLRFDKSHYRQKIKHESIKIVRQLEEAN